MPTDDGWLASQGLSDERIGYKWLWFGPLTLIVLVFAEHHTMTYAWTIGKLTTQRWRWAGLLSPSAAFCYGITISSILVPLQGILPAKEWLEDQSQPSKRILRVLFLLLLLLVFPFVTDTLIWGSFPFTYDAAGFGRLRLIPFIPWPQAGYGAF